MLDVGRPGACSACTAFWGAFFQLSLTNLASPGHIFSIAPSILDLPTLSLCLNEHRGFKHFPKKNRQSKVPACFSCIISVTRGLGCRAVAITRQQLTFGLHCLVADAAASILARTRARNPCCCLGPPVSSSCLLLPCLPSYWRGLPVPSLVLKRGARGVLRLEGAGTRPSWR